MSNLLPAGKFEVEVVDVSFGFSGGGTPFIKIGYKTDSGDFISDWCYLSEKAKPFTLKKLEALGYGGETPERDLAGDKWRRYFKTNVIIVVEDEEYNGTRRPRVRFVNKIRGKGPQSKVIASSDSKKSKAGVVAPPAKITHPVFEDGEEVPF